MERALFGDSDDEGAAAPSRAPAKAAGPKVRPFKRPPNMPAEMPNATTASTEGGAGNEPPAPAEAPSFAARAEPAGDPPAVFQALAQLQPPAAAPPPGPPMPAMHQAPAQQHGAGQQQQQQAPPSASPPPAGPPVPPMQTFTSTNDNAMTAFLHQPLGDFGSPNPAPPPSTAAARGQPAPAQDGSSDAGDSAADAAGGNGRWQRGVDGSLTLRSESRPYARESVPAAPSMAMSPRQTTTVRQLPNVRMTHTPLGQVQLPAMPSVSLPSGPQVPQVSHEDTAAWAAFNELRKQLEDSHNRTVALHAEISRMQIAHEKEAAALQASVRAQVEAQSRELQDMTDHYNSATAKLDQLTGVLARKADEIVKLEQRLHTAELDTVAMQHKVAHVEDRVKLADQARQVAEVRTRELELSLEHATSLIQSLRRQLNAANDDKNNALTEQYNTFEANRQQLIVFYAEREQFMLGSYAESLSNVQLAMQQYLHEREAEVETKWEETFRTQLDHQKSLHSELVTRADRHVEEMTKLKEEQEAEKEKAIAHMQREIKLADDRAQERMKNLVEDISRRERELGEREQRMRVSLAQAEQDGKIALLTREAEMKAQYDRLLEDAKKEFDKDRERLATAFREQIAALSAQHMANERELERLHREKEREMAQRYRVSNWDDADRRTTMESANSTARTQDVLLARMDKMQADQEARRLAARARFAGTAGGLSSGAEDTTSPTGGGDRKPGGVP